MQLTNTYLRANVGPSAGLWERLRSHAYVSMLYVGAVAGILAGTRWAEIHGLPGPKVFLAMLLIFPAALAGARLLFVALHWSAFRRHRARIWSTGEGGAALYGGLILSFLLSLPLLWAMRLPLGAFWDAVAIALLVGMIFTRIGCALQGCCAGRLSQSWLAFRMPDVSGIWRRRLPFPLLEAAVATVTLALCTRYLGNSSGGFLFLGSLAMYASGRWLLEPTREKMDRVRGWSVHRIISALLVALAITGFLLIWTMGASQPSLTDFAREVHTVAMALTHWYYLLLPLVVFAVMSLLRFRGCSFDPIQTYANLVQNDKPAAWFPLEELPGATTATNAAGTPDGTYGTAPSPLSAGNPSWLSAAVASTSLTLGINNPDLVPADPNDPDDFSIAIAGAYVQVPADATSLQNLTEFTVEGLVYPDWDTTAPDNYYCVLELAARVPPQNQPVTLKNQGFGLYAGPSDPTKLNSSYSWQVWMGNGTSFQFLQPMPFKNDPGNSNPNPGPNVEQQAVTYLASPFDWL